MRAEREQGRVVRFWRAVEMFNPQPLEQVDARKHVETVRPNRPLPWQPNHGLALARKDAEQGKTWRHVVYLGVFGLPAVSEALSRVFPPDKDEAYAERADGHSAVASFVVDEHGRPMLSSLVISTCAWAVGRLPSRGKRRSGWLDGYDTDAAELSEEFASLVTDGTDRNPCKDDDNESDGLGRPLVHSDLAKIRDLVVEALGVGQALSPDEVRIKSLAVSRRATAEDTQDFLNSFYLHDLAMVARRVETGGAGAALRRYLCPERQLDTSGRVDVARDAETVFHATAPNQIPQGRWPDAIEHTLASSQQVAVDHAWTMLHAGAGITGVNGPPGTGKTTMLRDLIAGLVVERARRLAELDSPDDAFIDHAEWKTKSGYTHLVSVWRPELTGFEVVVASSNNGAVENVTNEIPASNAIAEQWQQPAQGLAYFDGIGSALLAVDQNRSDPAENHGAENSPTAWAAVAARLGNMANRHRFAEVFWHRKSQQIKEVPWYEFTRLPEDAFAGCGLRTIMRWYEKNPASGSWKEATTRFRQKWDQVEHLREQRQRVSDAIHQHPAVADQVTALRNELVQAEHDYATASTTAVSCDLG